MKNIFKKLKFHPFFYFVIMITILTGNFKKFLLFMSIILFHEFGHILIGILFKWKIEKIVILPFGGLTIFNEYINRPLIEEFVVCLAGPTFQIMYYLIFCNFFDIKLIHYSLLLFNLLPIVPLDGSKLLNIVLNKLFPFKLSLFLSNIISLIISGLIISITIKYSWNLILFLTFLLLIFKTVKELKSINYIFNRFLLERHIKNLNIKRLKKIKRIKLNKMYRDYKHIFVCDNNYYTEREILRKRFDLQGKVW